MKRATWDEAKKARDGSLAPVVRFHGYDAGTEHYIRALEAELLAIRRQEGVLEGRIDELEEELDDLFARKERIQDELGELRS